MAYSEADTKAKLIFFILNRYESDGFTELADDKFSTLIKFRGVWIVCDLMMNFGWIT